MLTYGGRQEEAAAVHLHERKATQRMSGEGPCRRSDSERVGRHQDIIREVCLLPCYYDKNKWFCCFRLKVHLLSVVS